MASPLKLSQRQYKIRPITPTQAPLHSTPLYTDTSLTIDKRALLSSARSRSHLAHIAAYKAPQIAHPHALWPFAFAFKCCDAGAELKLERFSDIPDNPCHAMPCWLHHDFSGLLARLLLFFPAFFFQLPPCCLVCLQLLALIEKLCTCHDDGPTTMPRNAKAATKAAIANEEIRAIGTPNLICLIWHRCITSGTTNSKGFLTWIRSYQF